VLGLGTIPYAFIGGDTGYAVLLAGLFVRGLGLGATMMPAMAAAYATLDGPGAVPRATPMLNVLQRVGGSLGVAVLTVLLQNRIASNVRGHVADPLGAAFAHAYMWSLAGILIALIPALLLMREERRARRRAAAAGTDQPAPAPAIAA
jgi:hypothetical protein